MYKLYKSILSLILIIAFNFKTSAQVDFKIINVENNKAIHGFGFYFNNNIYMPEKLYDTYGLISRKPRLRYGVELGINYNPIIYKNLGLNIEIVAIGTAPIGAKIDDNDNIPDNSSWSNGEKGDILSGSYPAGSLVYWGFNLKLNYSASVKKHWIIQPELGVKLPYYPMQRVTVNIATFSDSFLNYRSQLNTIKANTYFYPDLIGGVNFLYKIKKSNKCLKFGINFDLSFKPKSEEIYEIRNLGAQYDSGGKVSYNFSYVGFLVGYQFFGVKNNKKELKKNNYIFNPRQ